VYQHPQTHMNVHEQRHADLLRQARHGELAAELAAARRVERKSFLARLWDGRVKHQPVEGRPAPTAG
jgi:hypothetical protein